MQVRGILSFQKCEIRVQKTCTCSGGCFNVYEHSSILKYCRAIVAMAVPCRKTTTSPREGVHRNNVNAVVTGALLNSRVVMYALCMTVTNDAQERLCHFCKSLKKMFVCTAERGFMQNQKFVEETCYIIGAL